LTSIFFTADFHLRYRFSHYLFSCLALMLLLIFASFQADAIAAILAFAAIAAEATPLPS
jgi:hypothetical protein